MNKIVSRSCTMFAALALVPAPGAGQIGARVADGDAAPRMAEWRPLPLATQAAGGHTHKLAGFAAGVTAGTLFMSLDGVLGSSCTGSGNYLLVCRAGLVGAAALGGGLGALAGALIRTEEPPGRATRVLIGSAVGGMGAFLVSTISCEQGDPSNPGVLCGSDGMVSTPAVLGAALVGGVVGSLLGAESDHAQIRQLGPVLGPSGGVGFGASVTVPVG